MGKKLAIPFSNYAIVQDELTVNVWQSARDHRSNFHHNTPVHAFAISGCNLLDELHWKTVLKALLRFYFRAVQDSPMHRLRGKHRLQALIWCRRNFLPVHEAITDRGVGQRCGQWSAASRSETYSERLVRRVRQPIVSL